MNKTRLLITTLAVVMCASVMAGCAHEHDYSEDWSSDANNHWHACIGEDCDEIIDVEEHNMARKYTADYSKEYDECSVCGYKSEEVTHTHVGGTASHTERAQCTQCGQLYGEVLGVAKVNGVGYDTFLEAYGAIGDEGTITILVGGTYTLPTIGIVNDPTGGKVVTIVGNDDVVIDMSSAVRADGSSLTFEGVTLRFDNDHYDGFQHALKETYRNCTIIGTIFNYAPEVVYDNCTFEKYDESTEYNVWTYGSTSVSFSTCEFNTTGKCLYVYNEWTDDSFVANISLTNCTFSSDGTFTNKAVVETGSNGGNTATSNKYNLTFTDCTIQSGFVANNSTSALWGNKHSMDTDHLNVVIDEVEVY